MGEAVYEEVVGGEKLGVPCRIYAPVGPHADLVAYLVRRLLENGANTSFVNRLADEEAPVAEIVKDPVATSKARRNSAGDSACCRGHRRCLRQNEPTAAGWRWISPSVRETLRRDIAAELAVTFAAAPIVDGKDVRDGGKAERCCARTIGASGSARCTSPMPRRLKPPSQRAPRRRLPGTGSADLRAPRSWSARPISTSAIACG